LQKLAAAHALAVTLSSVSQKQHRELSAECVVAWWRLYQISSFPEWRENLVMPKPELREGAFVFKVMKAPRRVAQHGKAPEQYPDAEW
jgi:hypothetical protein